MRRAQALGGSNPSASVPGRRHPVPAGLQGLEPRKQIRLRGFDVLSCGTRRDRPLPLPVYRRGLQLPQPRDDPAHDDGRDGFLDLRERIGSFRLSRLQEVVDVTWSAVATSAIGWQTPLRMSCSRSTPAATGRPAGRDRKSQRLFEPVRAISARLGGRAKAVQRRRRLRHLECSVSRPLCPPTVPVCPIRPPHLIDSTLLAQAVAE
jgi:hypothetical protein